MELNSQIKKYRTAMKLSQEELAEKVYVTRQTISNWETGKNYPDIHSLLLLSQLFDVSLDQLIKGDIDIMKEEIKETDLQKFNHYGTIFSILFIGTLISFVPLIKFLGIWGVFISVILFVITFLFSLKVEKFKKENDIHTYKEIVAFMDGKRLDEIDKYKEQAKRPYQKFLLALGSAIITFLLCLLLFWLLK